jgi:hypothetical protein
VALDHWWTTKTGLFFFNPVGADQNTPPDDPEILQRGREELIKKFDWIKKNSTRCGRCES